MTTPNYPQMAALVYGKCAAYDPYLAEPSEETCLAWAEQFALYGLELADLMAGVTKVYTDHGSGYRPLPKDIADAARAVRADRAARQGPTPSYEALCESKAADADELAAIRARRAQAAIVEDPARIKALTAGLGKAVRDA